MKCNNCNQVRFHINEDTITCSYCNDILKIPHPNLILDLERRLDAELIRTQARIKKLEDKSFFHENSYLLAENSELKDQLAQAIEVIEQIDNWAKAYPIDIFPLSASNMRHVINGVSKYTQDFLKQVKGDK